MRFLRHNEPFVNVAASTRAVMNSTLVLGNIVERVYLDTTGSGTFTYAQMNAIRVRLNGKVTLGDISGTQLNSIQAYQLNNTSNTSLLTVDFVEPDSRSMQGELLGSIDTNAAGVTSFVIEMDLGAATTPLLDSWSQLRDPASTSAKNGFNPNLAPLIRALIPTTCAATSASEQQFAMNLGSGGNSLLKRQYIFSSVLTSTRIKRNALDIYEVLSNARASFVQKDYAKVAQAGMTVADFLVDNNQADAIPTRNADGTLANFQFLLTASGAGTHSVFSDVYAVLGGI